MLDSGPCSSWFHSQLQPRRQPRNILHNRQGEVKLTDFGIAKARSNGWIDEVPGFLNVFRDP
jgi:serine/threonine protein kinase